MLIPLVCVCVVVLVPAFLPGVGGDSKRVMSMAMTRGRQTTLEDTRHHRAGGLVHETGGRGLRPPWQPPAHDTNHGLEGKLEISNAALVI